MAMRKMMIAVTWFSIFSLSLSCSGTDGAVMLDAIRESAVVDTTPTETVVGAGDGVIDSLDAIGQIDSGLSNGQPCKTHVECKSGYCVDSLCCDSGCTENCKSCYISGSKGKCSFVPAGQDPGDSFCGPNFACDGYGSCKLETGQKCSWLYPKNCATGFCKDSTCCESACDTPCRHCAAGTGICTKITLGTDDPECTGTKMCTPSATCIAKKKNGQTCTKASECLSGFCEGLKAPWHCCPNACSSGSCSTGKCCTHNHHKACSSGDVYWFDSCNNKEGLYKTCGSSQKCASGKCVQKCTLYGCSSSGFYYTCSTSSYTSNVTYCSGTGYVSSQTISFTNGHKVTCNYSCSGLGGSCYDDTGSSCKF